MDQKAKIRWSEGLYFTRNAAGEVILLTLYAKSEISNLSSEKLKEIRRVYE